MLSLIVASSTIGIILGSIERKIFNCGYKIKSYDIDKICLKAYKKDYDSYYYQFRTNDKTTFSSIILYFFINYIKHSLSHRWFRTNLKLYTFCSSLLGCAINLNWRDLIIQGMYTYFYYLGGYNKLIPIVSETIQCSFLFFYGLHVFNKKLSLITFKGEVPQSLTEEDYIVLKERY